VESTPVTYVYNFIISSSSYFVHKILIKSCPHCRRKVRLSPNSATVTVFSPFSATVALSATVWTGLKKALSRDQEDKPLLHRDGSISECLCFMILLVSLDQSTCYIRVSSFSLRLLTRLLASGSCKTTSSAPGRSEAVLPFHPRSQASVVSWLLGRRQKPSPLADRPS